MDAKEYISKMIWVDQTRILISLEKGRLLLVNVNDGAILAHVQGEPRANIVVSADKQSVWTIGHRIDHFTLPELHLDKSIFGLKYLEADRWRFVFDHDELPKARHYSPGVRKFHYWLDHSWITLGQNKLIGSAPPAGLSHNEQIKQGTELMEMCFGTDEARIQQLPNTENEPTRPLMSISPDGSYALRPHLEPIAKSKRFWPARLILGAAIDFGREGSPEVLFQDNPTADSSQNQVGFALELWRIDNHPVLEGLIVPEWYSQSTLRYSGAHFSNLYRRDKAKSAEIDKTIRDLLPTLRQLSNRNDKMADEAYEKLKDCFGYAEKYFNTIQTLNRCKEPMLANISRTGPDHIDADNVRWFVDIVLRPAKSSFKQPVWKKRGETWDIILLGTLGKLHHIGLDGRHETVLLPKVKDIPLSRTVSQNANAGVIQNLGFKAQSNESDLCALYRSAEDAVIATTPFEELVVATGPHSTILRPDAHASVVISAPLQKSLDSAAWQCVYTVEEKNDKEIRVANRMVNKGRFGIVSISGKSEVHYIKALEKLCSHFEKSPQKLVHDERYEPTFKRGQSFVGEKELCADLVSNNFTGCIPILDRLIAASRNFHGDRYLRVWHPDDATPTCAPMVFARFQLAGAFGDVAFDWLHGFDAGHDLYSGEELIRLAGFAPRDHDDFAKVACLFFWHEYFDGNTDDPRQMPYYLAAQRHVAEQHFQSTLKITLQNMVEKNEQYITRICQRSGHNQNELLAGISKITDWALGYET